jgi:hypothetical protein
MPRTQLNIDCEPDEKKRWKLASVQEGKSLACAVKELMNGWADFVLKPKPKSK